MTIQIYNVSLSLSKALKRIYFDTSFVNTLRYFLCQHRRTQCDNRKINSKKTLLFRDGKTDLQCHPVPTLRESKALKRIHFDRLSVTLLLSVVIGFIGYSSNVNTNIQYQPIPTLRESKGILLTTLNMKFETIWQRDSQLL
jgi:hypothetical protein